MALAILILGLALVVVGYRGTYPELASLLAGDLPGFLPWLAAIALVGALGYAPALEGVSNALVALVLLVIVLANGGAWANIAAAFTQPRPAAQSIGLIPTQADKQALAAGPAVTVVNPSQQSPQGGGAASGIGDALKALPLIGMFLGGP